MLFFPNNKVKIQTGMCGIFFLSPFLIFFSGEEIQGWFKQQYLELNQFLLCPQVHFLSIPTRSVGFLPFQVHSIKMYNILDNPQSALRCGCFCLFTNAKAKDRIVLCCHITSSFVLRVFMLILSGTLVHPHLVFLYTQQNLLSHRKASKILGQFMAVMRLFNHFC